MPNPARRAVALAALAAAIIAAAVALDLAPVAAQSDDEQTGRIVARRLDDGRTEFGWQPATIYGAAGNRVLPTQRYFPADEQVLEGEQVGRWLNSSPVEVEGAEIGRINARLHADGRIEFAFTPTDRERILTDARYFPAAPRHNRWLRSTEITIGPIVRYVAISALAYHNCAMDETGAIVCWGSNSYGATDTDNLEGSFIAVSAGISHSCAIAEMFETAVSNASASGEIVCWGWVAVGRQEINDASPTGRFSAVSAGRYHSCGLRESGAIECWITGDPTLDPAARINDDGWLAAPTGSFSAISTSETQACAIRKSGEIVCWGPEHDGQTDAPAGRFSAVSVTSYQSCAIRDTGAIVCWGGNTDGESSPPAGSFTAVAAGGEHTCAIRESDSAIVCWGRNTGYVWNEETGSEEIITGQADPPTGRFTAVAAGTEHTCAIRESGAIACWGGNWAGQTDVPTP